MDPIKPKQEPKDTTNLNSIPLANNTDGNAAANTNVDQNLQNAAANTTANQNLQNAAANTNADQNPQNAAANTTANQNLQNAAANTNADQNPQNAAANTNADQNPQNAAAKPFSLVEAQEFTARLRRGDATEAEDPVALAGKKFQNLAQTLEQDMDRLTLNEKERRVKELFAAETEYEMAKKPTSRKRVIYEDDLTNEGINAKSPSFRRISSGKVFTKFTYEYTDVAMVQLDSKYGPLYQVFNADLVDEEQFKKVPHYDDIHPRKISPAVARLAFASAIRGGPDTISPTFDIEDYLKPHLPKKSEKPLNQQKLKVHTIWIMGYYSLGPEKDSDGKEIGKGLWMMPRTEWERMRPSKDKGTVYEWGIGRAIRQTNNYLAAVEEEDLGMEGRKYVREVTPFVRADSESANDWRTPSVTPEATPNRTLSSNDELQRASSMVTEGGTPAPVSGGSPNTQDDQDYEAMSL